MKAPLETYKKLCKELRMAEMPDIHKHLTEGMTPIEIVITFLEHQSNEKQEQATKARIKKAGFPRLKTFKEYDFSQQDGVTAEQMKRLSDFIWLEQAFNVCFLGAPGLGKTHLATALGYAAASSGYLVCFTTLEGLMRLLKTAEISKASKARLGQMKRASMVIIDEMGFMPVTKAEAHLLFSFIGACYETKSLVITSNKGFEEWAELLGDPALTTAILDRLTYRCDVIMLNGKSYRLENRKSFLDYY